MERVGIPAEDTKRGGRYERVSGTENRRTEKRQRGREKSKRTSYFCPFELEGASLIGWNLPSGIANAPDEEPSTNSTGGTSFRNASLSFTGRYDGVSSVSF